MKTETSPGFEVNKSDKATSENQWTRFAEEMRADKETPPDSPEAKIKNPNYLRETYGAVLNRYLDRLYDGGEREDLDNWTHSIALEALVPDEKQNEMIGCRMDGENAFDQEVADRLGALLETSEISPEELVKDPLLRARHVEQIAGRRPEGNASPVENLLWELDGDFETSPEWLALLGNPEFRKENKFFVEHKELEKAIDTHPEIYTAVDTVEADRLTAEALEKISDAQLEKVLRLYDRDPEKGDSALLKTLLPVLGLEKTPPKIAYEENPARNARGGYNAGKNTITFFHRPKETKTLAARLKQRLSKEPISEQDLLDRTEIVAHETWHAHQRLGTNVPPERRELYLENWKNYNDGSHFFGLERHGEYNAQLIEYEAHQFGRDLSARMKELYARR